MKGGEEEREKAKGRKRRSEHRDRSVILLDSARSPVTFECSVDFTLAKGEEHRRKKKKTRTSIPSFSLRSSPFSPSPHRPVSSRHFSVSSIFSLFSFANFPSIQETSLRSISSLAVEKETEEEEGGKDRERERERRIDRDSP